MLIGEADIAVLAIDPHFQGYGNHWFSVQAVACTEIISFPYTPSARHPTAPRISLNHPLIAHVRKTVPFRIPPASPAAIRSAFLIEADQTLTAATCPQMTQGGRSLCFALHRLAQRMQTVITRR